MSYKISPSILNSNFGALSEEIHAVAEAGADAIHLDVMDGSFVPPITFGANVAQVAKAACSLFLDAHLMVEHPETHFDSFQQAGVNGITVHVESCRHIHRTLQDIKGRGLRAGVSLNPGTPIENIFPVLEVVDLVLIMTVNPGWGGQSFLPHSLSRLRELRDECQQRQVSPIIQVDGGINPETARRCAEAGATDFVVGSYIFGSKSYREAISQLRSALVS